MTQFGISSGRWACRAAFSRRLAFAVLAAVLLVSGCNTAPRADFASTDTEIAEILGFPDIRAWGDSTLVDVVRKGFRPDIKPGDSLEYLAISGGGSAGAFGAGALVGLTKSGRRPDFNVVSGVSTGALIAPFAFLGPDYDDKLEYIYTSGITKNLFRRRPLVVGLLGSGLVGPRPLRKLVEKYLDEKMLKAIGDEHRKGRRLVVITTNMDAQRPVLWDMGKIAASGQPGALKLFQDVLVASASIPAALPPVLIEAEAQGKQVQEMHSDGGTTVQVFTVPDGVLARADPGLLPHKGKAEFYMLVNYTLVPEFQVIDDGTFAVGQRGLSTLLKAQTRNSVIATYGFLKQAGIPFHLASIDKIVPYDPSNPFDPEYMRKLFDLGYSRAVAGQLWDSSPINDLSTPPKSTAREAAAAASSKKRGGVTDGLLPPADAAKPGM